MSYERRLEIEALPAESGWARWEGVIGHGTELVERKQLAPITAWVATINGPREVEAYRYERWRFAEGKQAVDKHFFTYTVWHTDRDYTDYSPRTVRWENLGADSREELCEKARSLLENDLMLLAKEIAAREKQVATLTAMREKFN